MKNSEVADVLYEIADMLEMQGIQFKPNAYRKAARSVEESSEDVNAVYKASGRAALQKKFAGVGASISEKIGELLTTGKLGYYEKLKKQFPKHISELMEVPGLGPKRIRLLHGRLKISNLSQLEDAAKKHKISALAGFGKTSEEDILKGIGIFRRGRERMLLGYALPQALEIEAMLKGAADNVSIAGSLRRRKETIGDIDILAASSNPGKVMNYFVSMPDVSRVLAKGMTKSSVLLKSGLQVDLRVVDASSFGAALQYFTGSKEHNIALREIAARKRLKLNEYGLFRGKKRIAGKTEAEIYRKLGIGYMEPELRENRGELSLRIPKIIPYNSILGDLHTHTRFSDGADSVEDMVSAAKKLGYGYIAITDHSKSTRIAHGLSEEKMLSHINRIKAVGKKIKGIKVLAGSEVDILPDGGLDYPDSLLKKMDVVIGSVHSRFKSSGEQMTSRIITALQNPHLDILGHPTGRLIGRREPYDADLKKVFRAAADNHVYLEINSHPERTDLNDINVMAAKQQGCRFVISTDAHSTAGLEYMQLGTAVARRAWLASKDVVNTASAKQFLNLLKK
ncbi:DNA polymerase/3'-5' exonuclease PolX [Candidatus Woesearchaeota archaeon]|nr:DNA polymerase/3'-5' exonuclease PolX [Candidatus Woesearchaeota archaeon]